MNIGIGIGIYGENGHQVTQEMIDGSCMFLAGIAAADPKKYHPAAVYASLGEMLEDERIGLVSVCSPRRDGQAADIKKILLSGRHVYAEKPCVMSIREMDELTELAKDKGLIFCEMAGTAFEAPYCLAKKAVQEGRIGKVVQICAQKSYPYADWRPQDEGADGGLILQNAVHGLRFVEHVAGCRIKNIMPLETAAGNPLGRGTPQCGNNPQGRDTPQGGGLKMACSLQMELEGGGLATVTANYLNQPSTGVWGYEELKLFGTKGILKTDALTKSVEIYTEEGHCTLSGQSALTGERTQAGQSTHSGHYIQAGQCREELFTRLTRMIVFGEPFPYNTEELMHPTRMALEAKELR